MYMNTSVLQSHDELDLAIANMDSPEAERAVSALLKPLPGVRAVRLIERGAWIDYNASAISADEITAALHRAGFRAGLFQDSRSGRTGTSTV